MRNDDQRRRGDFSGREFGQGGGRDYGERDFGEPDWQGGGYRERGQHRAGSSLFQSGQERRNQFERSNYGNMDDDGAGGRRSSQYGMHERSGPETGYGGYDGEYGDYGARGSRGGRGTGAGQGGELGGFQRGDDYGSSGYGGGGGYGGRGGRHGGRDLPYPGGEESEGNYRGGQRFQSPGGGAANWEGGSYRGFDRFGGDASESQGGRSQRYMPKGYQRSDERIREDVCERLAHSGIDVSEVSVDVVQGHVTLSGTVPERYMKHAIEDYADDCAGVQDVDNRIRVQRGGTGGSTPGGRAQDISGAGGTSPSGGATSGGSESGGAGAVSPSAQSSDKAGS